MNDIKQGNAEVRSLTPVVGFALGALVGGVLALLLAPASGEETRRRLGAAARRLSRDARRTIDEARETVAETASGLGEDVKSAMDAGREAFRNDGEPQELRPLSRLAQTGNSSPPQTP
jgi:gas vesicle protein